MIAQRVTFLAITCAAVLGWSAESAVLGASQGELLQKEGPLSRAELEIVLARVRKALDGETLRLSTNGFTGAEVLMGSDGLPRVVRFSGAWTVTSGAMSETDGQRADTSSQDAHVDSTTIIEYTRRQGHSCGGRDLGAELVIEYTRVGQGGPWAARPRTRTAHEFASPVFDMLSGAIQVSVGPAGRVADRHVRALVAPWRPRTATPQSDASDPMEMIQSLWIDTESMKPVLWSVSAGELSLESSSSTVEGYQIAFNYDPSVSIDLPRGADSPGCVR